MILRFFTRLYIMPVFSAREIITASFRFSGDYSEEKFYLLSGCW
jgi:hypothetical protein